MNPLYIGNCDIEEVPGSELTIKRGQAAVLTRQYRGNRNELATFVFQLGIAVVTDYQFPSMVLDEIKATWDGPEGTATLTFYGLPSVNAGNPGQLQSNARWYSKSTLLATDNPADGLWAVNYKAPTITYRYSTSARLSDPQYQDYSESPSTIVIKDAQQYLPPGFVGPPNPTRQGNFLYQAFSICDDFQRDQKGNIYNYQETWGVYIQQPKTQAAGTLSLDGAIAPSSL